MRGEIPQFKRCCCCLPLRRGLIAWAYAKLALDILSINYFITLFILIRARFSFYLSPTDIALWIVIGIILLTDICFSILFIVAGHRKSARLLRIAYVYNVTWLSLILLAHCFQIYRSLRVLYLMWNYVGGLGVYYTVDMMIRWGLAFSVIFVQVYLILLIRSEVLKLQNQSLAIEFTNRLETGEPQCTLHKISTSNTDQSTSEKTQEHVVATSDMNQHTSKIAQANNVATTDISHHKSKKVPDHSLATSDTKQHTAKVAQANDVATFDTNQHTAMIAQANDLATFGTNQNTAKIEQANDVATFDTNQHTAMIAQANDLATFDTNQHTAKIEQANDVATSDTHQHTAKNARDYNVATSDTNDCMGQTRQSVLHRRESE